MLALLPIAFAISLEASQIYTIPEFLENEGFLYLTFCSSESETCTLEFTGYGFEVEPSEQEISFSPVVIGTAVTPDCKTIAVKVKSSSPGMKTLKIEGDNSEWYVPVIFGKLHAVEIAPDKLKLYTGYNDLRLWISGNASDVYLSLNASVLGKYVIHTLTLPADFVVKLYFPKPGFYAIPVQVSYKLGNARFSEVHYIGLRVEEFPLKVTGNASLFAGEEGEIKLNISSPEKLYGKKVIIQSPCIEGETEKFLPVIERNEVSFRVKPKCDPGVYALKVFVGSYEREIPLEIKGPEGYEIFLNPSKAGKEEVLEVVIANHGPSKISAASVKLLPGNYTITKEGGFIGDIDAGDFDSTEVRFIPYAQGKAKVLIRFYRAGKLVEITREYSYSYARKSFLPYLGIALIAVVAYALYRKSGSKVSS